MYLESVYELYFMTDLSARKGRPHCEKNFSSLVLDNRIFMI